MSFVTWMVHKAIGTADIVRAFLKGSERIEGLDVAGSQDFRRAVAEALLLLRDNRIPAWDTLSRHVGTIVEGTRTVTVVTAHPAFMYIDGPSSRQDPTLLAGTIAFLACSCELHRRHEAEFPGRRVPRDVYSSAAAVECCEKAHEDCLLALGRSAGT
jgi:hypothetical protein